MFTGALIEVAKEILIVGGAVCVIMLFFVLLWCMVCLVKISRLIGTTKHTVQQALSIANVPMMVLQKILSEKKQ